MEETYGMSEERYEALMADINSSLTEDEEAVGWYFSSEYDGLLVNRWWAGHELTDEEWEGN